MLHGPQVDVFDLSFSVPAECADRVGRGEADLGILPVAEIQRLNLSYLPDVGIACTGAVRSILLITKTAPEKIRTLAADASSRTSVMLARVVLALKYGCRPEVRTLPPNMDSMLESCDAALLIGDPALRIDPDALPFPCLDLGAEWTGMTGLPMVFALWSGPSRAMTEQYRNPFVDSCRFGIQRMDDLVAREALERGFPEDLVRTYLTRHIQFELGLDHMKGMDLFFQHCAAMRG